MTRLNLDLADTWTDATLDEIVDHLDSVYRQAYREMKEERDKSFSLFVKADKDKQKQLENGTITEEYYKQWRLGWIRNNEKMQSLMDDYAKKATETNKIASDYINGITPEVFMYNHNFTAYEFEKGTGVSFSIVDKNTVKELATNKNHSEFRTISINPKRDYAWNRKQIQRTLTAGIIQGKSIPKIAKDFYKVMGNNKSASVRNARTAVTSAQNGGRQKGFEQAHDLGIKFKKEWLSAHDGRVRDSHAHLDGVRVEYDEKFPNGLMYPGDPQGHPGEVYNCRCTLIANVNGMRGKRTNNTVDSYNRWLENKADESDLSDKARRWLKNISREEKLIGYEELPKKLQKSFEKGLEKAQAQTRTLLDDLYEHVDYIYDENGKNLHTISYIRLNSKATKTTIAHELFHRADRMYGISDELKDSIEKDKKMLASNSRKYGSILNYLKAEYPEAFEDDNMVKNEYRRISDIIHGMTNGTVCLGFGHFGDYWSKKNKLQKEIWAQYGAITYENDEKVVEMFNEVFPNILQSAIKQLEDINNAI